MATEDAKRRHEEAEAIQAMYCDSCDLDSDAMAELAAGIDVPLAITVGLQVAAVYVACSLVLPAGYPSTTACQISLSSQKLRRKQLASMEAELAEAARGSCEANAEAVFDLLSTLEGMVQDAAVAQQAEEASSVVKEEDSPERHVSDPALLEKLSCLEQVAGDLRLHFHIKPGQSRNEVLNVTDLRNGVAEAIRLAVAAPPRDGEANAELTKFLAKVLGVPRTSVTIKSGQTSHNKCIAVSGADLTARVAIERLLAH
eukprot:TRINITY_DN65178_c0_g1_i1.p1 TRINITY_DN65178_c0_g1~~TRINITY_DN65178_c0_g1_i1.p1  ORF type:complete len:257 (+),score=65.09 TRINITY_DN65178_c0_g1_i1:121-891(+)